MNDFENKNLNENTENHSSYSYSYPETSRSNVYDTTVDPAEPQPKRKKGVVTRVIAFAVCAAVISAGSISAYRFIDNGFSFRNFFGSSTSESSNDDTSSSSSTLAASNAANKNEAEQKSLIELASRTDSMSLPDAVDKVMPAVVGISSQFAVPTQSYSPDWFFGMPFGSDEGQTQQKSATATGTGIVMTSDGYIITNAHVIYDTEQDTNYGKAQSVSVVMSDKTNYDASIIGYDTDTDIAVLKIDASGLTPADFGNSDDLKVGELVLAIGNPLGFELFGSVTSGIVSALNREISVNDKQMSLIQTDAPINNGNSGGPLVNSYGQVVGINSAKMSSAYTSSATIEGLGFAIPITQAKTIIDDLISYGYVKGRAQLGLTSIAIDESTSNLYGIPVGLYVRSVTPNGAADLAGITAGDVIIGVDNDAVSTTDKLKEIISKHKAGEEITVKVNRNGQDMDIKVTLQEITKGDTLFGDKEVQAN